MEEIGLNTVSALIEKGTPADIDELSQLYDDLHDYLESTINYPCWKKGVYPTRENAAQGIADGNLYVTRQAGKIVGSVILNREHCDGTDCPADTDRSYCIFIYTLVIHPAHLKEGIGSILVEFAIRHGLKEHVKSVRLDVYEKNLPAIRLYEKSGFVYVKNLDLGIPGFEPNCFRLYEKLL
jgi:ribosomal protein S18 acetylase RimI-like enzyme